MIDRKRQKHEKRAGRFDLSNIELSSQSDDEGEEATFGKRDLKSKTQKEHKYALLNLGKLRKSKKLCPQKSSRKPPFNSKSTRQKRSRPPKRPSRAPTPSRSLLSRQRRNPTRS